MFGIPPFFLTSLSRCMCKMTLTVVALSVGALYWSGRGKAPLFATWQSARTKHCSLRAFFLAIFQLKMTDPSNNGATAELSTAAADSPTTAKRKQTAAGREEALKRWNRGGSGH